MNYLIEYKNNFWFKSKLISFTILFLYNCQSNPSNTTKKAPFFLRPLSSLIKYHIEKGTHVDGPRCSLYPSCATYAKKAIEQHGYRGFLMALDRLIYRETGELYTKYFCTPRKLSKYLRYYDPLDESLPLFASQKRELSFLKEDFNCYK